jgi:[acyl-carrier-protein] S-malonyltransferase
MPFIHLCPGQGAQHVGMARAWVNRSPAAARTFEQADKLLDIPLSRLCFEGPEDDLHRTDIGQAAIYVASVACFRALEEEGLLDEPPGVAAGDDSKIAAAAGLSLGEFTALHLAGAMQFEDCLKLVRLRGQAMQDAAQATPSGMVALVGADEVQATTLCYQASADCGGSVIVPANYNCPGQVVISGAAKACERAIELAATMGLRATPLAVAGAFHSPLMAPAAERLAEALERTSLRPPSVPVVSNVTARPHENDVSSIRRRLLEQLTSPVRWAQSMQWLIGEQEGRFVELSPGKVLTGLMRRIDRKTNVLNLAVPPAEAVASVTG